jgi:2-dehydro-3-deoxygluconokinase
MYHSVFIGEVMVELPMTESDTVTLNVAGDTFNSAIYFKRVFNDSQVSYLTAIGTDKFSQRITQFAAEEGIDTSLMLKHRNRLPGLYAIETDSQGERSFHYWRDRSAAKDLMNLAFNHGVSLNNTDLIYFTGITLAVLCASQRQMFLDFLKASKANGATIAFDPNYRPILWEGLDDAVHWTVKAYSISDIVFPGIDDHAAVFGHTSTTQIVDFLSPMLPREIILKDGANPVRVVTPFEDTSVAITPVKEVVDTTSAGDGFTAGYLACRAKQMSVTLAAKFAAGLAGTIIRHPGAIIPRQLMNNNHIGSLSGSLG